MKRYEVCDNLGLWSVFDKKTGEYFARATGSGVSRGNAGALADLLNALNNQESWRSEAASWPMTVALDMTNSKEMTR